MSRVSLSTLQLAAGGIGAALVDDVQTQPTDRTQPDDATGVSTFDSAAEFRSYLQEADAAGRHTTFTSSTRTGAGVDVATDDTADDASPVAQSRSPTLAHPGPQTPAPVAMTAPATAAPRTPTSRSRASTSLTS